MCLKNTTLYLDCYLVCWFAENKRCNLHETICLPLTAYRSFASVLEFPATNFIYCLIGGHVYFSWDY